MLNPHYHFALVVLLKLSKDDIVSNTEKSSKFTSI